MKFSKLLRGLVEENPGMEDLVISYKKLKKIIKKLATHEENGKAASLVESGVHDGGIKEEKGTGIGSDGPSAADDSDTPPGVTEPLQNGGTTAGSKDGTTAASAPSVLTDEDREFLVMLQGDVHRFNQYFMDKEEELVIRLQIITDRLRAASRGTQEHIEALQELVVFHGEAVQLLHWSALNFAGLSKILKKHDKISGVKLKDFYQVQAMQMPFQSTEILTNLVRTAEEEVGRHIPLPPNGPHLSAGSGRASDSSNPLKALVGSRGGQAPSRIGAAMAERADDASDDTACGDEVDRGESPPAHLPGTRHPLLAGSASDSSVSGSDGEGDEAPQLPHIHQQTLSALRMWEALQHASTPSTLAPEQCTRAHTATQSESTPPPAKRHRTEVTPS